MIFLFLVSLLVCELKRYDERKNFEGLLKEWRQKCEIDTEENL